MTRWWPGAPAERICCSTATGAGQPGLWAQRILDAAPAGDPQLLIANLNVGVGMGITRDGSLHYPVRVTRRRLKIAELDLTTGQLLREPVNVTGQFVGSNNMGRFSGSGLASELRAQGDFLSVAACEVRPEARKPVTHVHGP